jgi:hypothetical protein
VSAKSVASFQGLTKARQRLADLTAALKSAPEILERAAAKVAAQVESVAKLKLSRHQMTGAALAETKVDLDGLSVKLHGMPARNAKNAAGKSYVSLFSWWPFRGRMPPFIVKNAALILAREAKAALGGEAPPEAASIVAEADEADAKKAEKKANRKPRKAKSNG